jgi:aconitase A
LTVGGLAYEVFRLDRVDGAARLPYSLKVLLENLLRNEDGALVTAEQVNALGAWDPTTESGTEIQFTRRGCCCRTSPGCHVWWIWSRCVTPWPTSAATRAGSTRSSRPSWSSTTR